jgi:hypothetical protein
MNYEITFNVRSRECTQVGLLNTDLIVTLPIAIVIPEDSVCEMSVVSAEIPLSFYNISADLINNVFSYYVSGNPTLQNITIPDGNYTVDSLMLEINDSQGYFSLTYDETFNKFFVTLISPAFDLILLYDINNYNNQIFGVNQNQLFISSGFITGVVNLASVHSLQIRTSLNTGSTISTSNPNSNVCQKIPLEVNPYGIIIHTYNNYIQKSYIKSGSIKTFSLQITEQNNKLINLLGCVYELSFLFKIIKVQTHITEEQKISRKERLNQRSLIEPPIEVSASQVEVVPEVSPPIEVEVPPEVEPPPPITLSDVANELLSL